MKTTFITLLFAIMTMSVAAQNTDNINAGDTLVRPSEAESLHVPKYIGGVNALIKFLQKNLNYPKQPEQYGAEANVHMIFFVDTDGSVSDIEVENCKITKISKKKFWKKTKEEQHLLLEQFTQQFTNEAVRVVQIMPRWIPGELNGEPIKVKYNLPIRFMLPN